MKRFSMVALLLALMVMCQCFLPLQTAKAEEVALLEKTIIDKLTVDYLFDGLGDALTYGVVAREWEQNNHAETSVCVDVLNKTNFLPFMSTWKTYMHGAAFPLYATVSMAEVPGKPDVSLQGMQFALCTANGNDFTIHEDTIVTVTEKTKTTVVGWDLEDGDPLLGSRMYVRQVEKDDNGNYYIVEDGDENSVPLTVEYGDPIVSSAPDNSYIGTMTGDYDVMSTIVKFYENDEIGDHNPSLTVGPGIKIVAEDWYWYRDDWGRMQMAYGEVDLLAKHLNYRGQETDHQPSMWAQNGELRVSISYTDNDGVERTTPFNDICYRYDYENGEGYFIIETPNGDMNFFLSQTTESDRADKLLKQAAKISEELGNMRGGILRYTCDEETYNNTDPSLTGNSTVSGPEDTTNSNIVSLYDINLDDWTLDQDDIHRLTSTYDPEKPGDSSYYDAVMVASNEYVVFNIICPAATGTVDMSGVSSFKMYRYAAGADGLDQAEWDAKDTGTSDRVLFNFVYKDGNTYKPFEGTIHPVSQHGGTLLAPNAYVECLTSPPHGTIIADRVYNKRGTEIHQRTMTNPAQTTFVHMLGDGPAEKGHIKVVKVESTTLKKLEGAEFALYKDKACTQQVGKTEKTKKEGDAQFRELEPGTYYVKEVTAPKDYMPDNTVYEVEVVGGITTLVGTKGYIENTKGKGNLRLTKIAEENINEPLEGAKFMLYSLDADTFDEKKATLLGTYTTDKRGNITERIEAGTYWIKEIEAPFGYDIGETGAVKVVIEKDKTTTVGNVTINGKNYFTNKKKPTGTLAVVKVDADDKTVKLYGAEFTVYSDAYCTKGNELTTFTTGDDGAGNVTLPVGSYWVKETKAPSNYVLSDKVYDVTIKANETVMLGTGGVVTNDHVTGKVWLQKITSESGTDQSGWPILVESPLEGAWFGVYNNSACLPEHLVAKAKTGADGKVTFELKANTGESFWAKEIAAPTGYVTSDQVTGPFWVQAEQNVQIKSGYWVYGSQYTDAFVNNKAEVTGRLVLYKVDENGAPLNGAYFGVYTDKECNYPITGSPFTTSGDNAKMQVTGLVPGTYYVQEYSAPTGYERDMTVYEVKVEPEYQLGTNPSRVNGAGGVVKNQKVSQNYGGLELTKKDTSGTALRGVEFTVYSDEACETDVATMTTDENGVASIAVDKLAVGNYWVKETKALTGYAANSTVYPVTVTAGQITAVNNGNAIINSVATSLSGTKVWVDYSNYLNIRPDKITLIVLCNGVAMDPQPAEEQFVWTNTDKDTWNWTINGLRKYADDGSENVYTVEETGLPADYKSEISGNTITNTSIYKGSIVLYKYTEEGEEEIPLSGAVFGVYTDKDCKKPIAKDPFTTDENGLIELRDIDPGIYYVKELIAPKGYILDSEVKVIDVKPEFTPGTTWHYVPNEKITYGGLELTKTDESGNPLAGVVFTVYSDEACKTEVATMTTDANGKASIAVTELPVGPYWVKETGALDGYVPNTTVYPVNVVADTITKVNGGTIINKKYESVDASFGFNKVVTAYGAPELKDSFTVKVVPLNGAPALTSDDEVVVNLDETGMAPGSWQKEYTYADCFKVTFTKADVYTYEMYEEAASPIPGAEYHSEKIRCTFTVVEDAATGKLTYTSAFAVYDANGQLVGEADEAELYNEYTLRQISAKKEWYDENNVHQLRPASIQVQLYADGDEKDSPVELNEANQWSYVWSYLPKYGADGSEIEYTVEEVGTVPGYAADVQGDMNNGFTLVNKLQKGGLELTKTDESGNPLKDVVFTVYSDEACKTEVATMTTDADGKASIAVTDLPVGTYYVKETGALDGYVANNTVYTVEVKDGEIAKVNEGKAIVNTAEKKYGGLELTKTDEGNKPLAGVVFTVYSDEACKTEVATMTTDADGKASIAVTDLPVGTYYVKETGALTGYTADTTVYEVKVTDGKLAQVKEGQPIINKKEKTDVSVTKVWSDGTNADLTGLLKLYSKTAAGETPINSVPVYDEAAKTYTWTGLDKYDGEELITYIVREEKVEGYVTVYASDKGYAVSGETITNNKIEAISAEFTLNKIVRVWGSAELTDTVTFEVEALNGAPEPSRTEIKIAISETGRDESYWDNSEAPYKEKVSFTFDKAGVYSYLISEAAGTNPACDYESAEYRIEYTVTLNKSTGKLESALKVYVVGADGSEALLGVSGLIDFMNDYIFTKVSVEKKWVDNDNQDGLRPQNITVQLLADDVAFGAPVELNEANSWKHTWTGLTKQVKNENGEYTDIVYDIEEISVKGYTGKLTGDAETGFILTNTHETERIAVSVEKRWEDGNNQDGIRPASITVQLRADGVAYGDAVVLNEANSWKHVWSNLDKQAGGKQITYTIDEIEVEGYTAVITGDATTGFIITNTHKTSETSVSVEKVWDDNNDQDGLRPDSITVQLLADGAVQDEVELNAANGWTYEWTGLAKNRTDATTGTAEIEYTVKETAVEGYTGVITGNAATGFVITNTHDTSETSVSVEKVWDDNNDQDGLRPQSITVQLLADDVVKGEVELNAANGWTYEWTGLAKNRTDATTGTAEIEYTVKETEVEGYTGEISGDAENGFIITNTHKTSETSVSVEKVWDDNDDQDGLRPQNITVQLLADDVAFGAPVELNEANSWKHTWTDLATKKDGTAIAYTVKETAVEGYTGVITGNAATGFVITNTHETSETSVSVAKVWDDNNDQDGLRPDSITVQLLADDVVKGEVELNAANGWTYEWTGLAKNRADATTGTAEIEYTVKETAVEGYTGEITGDAENGFIITNTHETAKTSVSVEKVWDDNDDQDGLRPDSITVQLRADGVAYGDAVVLNEANSWKHVWSNLDKQAGGKQITYTIDEIAVEGYTAVITGDATTGFIITNTHKTSETSVSVEKVWDDNNDQDGLRPDSITVQLLADGAVQDEVVLNAANSWKYIWTDLATKKDGTAIVYTVKETAVEGYTGEITGNAATGFVITNTHDTSETSVSVEKNWVDNNDQDGIRPESITVQLLADGVAQGDAVVLNAENSWKHTWTDLATKKDGKAIVYTVKETAVEGYTGVITGNAATGFVITNTHETSETSVSVEKKWVDNNDQDGIRPESITVQLLADGVAQGDAVVLNAENSWKHTWTDLATKKDGTAIAYTVKETAVEGYTGVITGNAATGFVITNTHETEVAKTSVSGTKTWADNNDVLGKRPATIVVNLLADGAKVDSKTVTGTGDVWSYEFTDLPKYTTVNGQQKEIVYTVTEEPVEYYQTTVNGYDITNSCTYKASGSLLLKGEKNLTGNVLQVAEKTFSFGVYVGDEKVAEGWNTADGQIVFENIQYTLEDIGASYIYAVREIAGLAMDDEYSYGYDDTIYTVMVEITDGGDGNLIIDETYFIGSERADGIAFANEVNYREGGLSVKKVDSKDTTLTLKGAEFSVYSDASCRTFVGRITTGVNGEGSMTGLPVGRYYVKETKAPEGYVLKDTVYTVDVVADTLTKVNGDYVTNDKQVVEGSLTLKKRVVGADGTAESFTFDIVLSGGEQLAGSYDATVNGVKAAPVVFTQTADGAKATVSLRGGDTLVILGLTEGVSYTVTEQANNRYDVQANGKDSNKASGVISGNAASTVDFLNTLKQIDFTVKKEWQGAEGGEIELILYANGVAMKPQPEVIREGNTYTYKGLPTVDENGAEIIYTVKETTMPGYVTIYKNDMPNADKTNAAYNGGTIINQEQTSFMVKKVWEGLAAGEDAPVIKLLLYCNGELYSEATPTPNADGWYVYNNLPVMVDGVKAVYSVVEQPVEGFVTTYTNIGEKAEEVDSAYNGGTIVNSKIPQTGDEAPLALWLSVALLALGGLLGLATVARKRENW